MYARARIAFVLKLYYLYLSTIFCQQHICLMGDAILRIPRDARVRAYRAWDTYDGVVSATSKRQPSCQSSFIYVSGAHPTVLRARSRPTFHTMMTRTRKPDISETDVSSSLNYIVYCSEINKSVELCVREHKHIILS